MPEEKKEAAEKTPEPVVEKKEEEVIPQTPLQKVAQRIDEEVAVHLLLRYMHAQSSVPKPIRKLVGLAQKLVTGLAALFPLTADLPEEEKGILRSSPGSEIEGASDLVVAIRKLDKVAEEFEVHLRAKVKELAEEG